MPVVGTAPADSGKMREISVFIAGQNVRNKNRVGLVSADNRAIQEIFVQIAERRNRKIIPERGTVPAAGKAIQEIFAITAERSGRNKV